MTDEQSENVSKLKPYQIILISCLLGSILVVNSNYVNKNRDLARLNKQKEELFDSIIQRRNLQSQNYSEEVCSRASDDLIEYYRTGDLSKIDIDENGAIECKNKDSGYMKALISVVRSLSGDDDEDSKNVNGQNNDPWNGGDVRNLEDLNTDDLLDYSLDRILPMAVFLVFGILGYIGWVVCCFCCCCNCCCCCCCKKTSCKLPCFVFTYIFYALAIAVCVYGLTQANKIFVGLANTECSLLKFFDQVIDGEMKQETPRWAGINSITNLLTKINTTINDLSVDSYTQLNDNMNNLTSTRNSFIKMMNEVGDKFYDGTNYLDPYKQVYTTKPTSYHLAGEYIYDLVFYFGRYDGSRYTKDSFLDFWDQEFSIVDDKAYGYLSDAKKNFKDILNDNLEPIQEKLGDGKDKLDELMEPFTDANDEIGEILNDISESIDKYGKMGVKIVFGVLMLMNIALAILVLLICMFSGKSCTNCCCCRCLFKCFTHLIWNILAYFMCVSFLIGSLIALFGRIGGDTMGVLSYIMSIENFNGSDHLIISELGSAKDYIYTCIHGDGNIAAQLGLGNSLNSFEEINNVENNITIVKNNFTNLIDSLPTYNLIRNHFEKQVDYGEDITLIPKGGIKESEGKVPISYQFLLGKINELNIGGKWSNNSDNKLSCSATLPSNSYYHPKYCKPYDYSSTNTDFNKYADILKDEDKMVDHAKGDHPKDTANNKAESFMRVVNNLKKEYNIYLNGYTNILEFFLTTIRRITNIIRPYIGDGDAFSFLNGKFIGTNLKIILKYLEHSLGGDFYTVGICLCIVGLSLILSISSTILLIVIMNIELDENKQKEQQQNKSGGISEYRTNNPGIIIPNYN